MANITLVTQVKGMIGREDVERRFKNILGKKAAQFTASLINVVSGTPALQECDVNSIMAAAFVAASFDLPIDGNLGFSAIVPYKKKAQFQMMTKGYVQLAIRTGAYERINSSVVYEDELVGYNPITGECHFVDDFSSCTQRREGNQDKVVGFYSWFKLKTGYKQELYMSKDEMIAHAKNFSTSYKYDLSSGKRNSTWSTNFNAMGKKTVTKLLLSRWGILSVSMQKAIADDQKVFDETGKGYYGDNMKDETVVTIETGSNNKKNEEIIEEFDITK